MSLNLAPNNHVRLSSVWLYDDASEIVNVVHVRLGSTVASSDADVLDDLAEFVEDVWENVVPAMSNLVTHDRIEVKNVTLGGVFGSLPANANLDGTDSSANALPPQTTALVIFPTLISRIQGRVYLPPFSEASNNAGFIDPAKVAMMDAFGAEMLLPYTGPNGTEMSYIVRASSGTGLVPVSTRSIPTFRTQRRRTIGRGS